ncbi:MAG: right-handed parallel beta-helix repeat-containing protein [Candidatus Eiseniibacteriota bacterium]|jgi:hypothetical protein
MLASRCPVTNPRSSRHGRAAGRGAPVALAMLVLAALVSMVPPAAAQSVYHISSDSTMTAIGASYTLVGVTIVDEGATLTIEPGVWVRAAQDAMLIVLGNLHCVGTADSMIVFQTLLIPNRWGGICLHGTDDTARIEHTRIYRTQPMTYQAYDLTGAVTARSSDVSITDCEFEDDFYGGGAWLRYATGIVARNHFITFRGQVISAIYSSVDVVDNVIEYAGQDAIEYGLNPSPVQITGNVIAGNDDDGIDVDGGFIGTISGNYIHTCADKGISVADTSLVTISNNIIWDCARAIRIADGSTAELWNNTLTQCFWGLQVQQSNAGYGGATATAHNNVIYGNSNQVYVDALSALTLTYSCVEGDTAYAGEGNINTDPAFAAGDTTFHLQAGSSCIDAGLYAPGCPELDFDGEERIDDLWVPNSGSGDITYVDIGADEFQPDPAGVPVEPAPALSRLFRVRPNPVRPGAALRLDTPGTARGRLVLYDVQGRLRRAWNDILVPGELAFDGRDKSGRRLADGVYYLEFRGDARRAGWTGRLVIVR